MVGDRSGATYARPVRVLMLANRRSGTGGAARLAGRLADALRNAGHRVEVSDPAEADLNGSAEVVVAVGGDGTIHHALPGLVDRQLPVFHAPGGNENLFARQFGMGRSPEALVRALERPRLLRADVGLVGRRPFAIMVSVGPDAGVIHRLHEGRSRATGHAMYLGPTLRECLRPHLPRLRILVDGRELVGPTRGFVVVANCRRYALGLDPARRADMTDGLLDVVFFPASSTAGALVWLARCVAGDPARWGAPGAAAAEIRIEALDRAPWQVDGEAGGWIEPGGVLTLGVSPGALSVVQTGGSNRP
jgi:diacylglycerol kinase (ATP)